MPDLEMLIRDVRPVPDPAWTARLDARVAARFPGPPPRWKTALTTVRDHVLAIGAVGAVASLIVVFVIAGVSYDGAGDSGDSGSSGAASAPAAQEGGDDSGASSGSSTTQKSSPRASVPATAPAPASRPPAAFSAPLTKAAPRDVIASASVTLATT